MVPVAVLVGVTATLIGGPAADTVVTFVAGTISWLVPFALGAAALRYRLYDLDRIISRTVAYGLLTVLLGLGYAVVVLGLGRLLPEGSSLVVAAATLAVAAAFQPLRRRVQGLVDRRFNRRRYDAAGTVDAFSARLRDQLDLDALHGELLAVVDQTMQPTRASLWLRR
jgi:peptidoglycan/LPS O-acetylase OafA/YrhL